MWSNTARVLTGMSLNRRSPGVLKQSCSRYFKAFGCFSIFDSAFTWNGIVILFAHRIGHTGAQPYMGSQPTCLLTLISLVCWELQVCLQKTAFRGPPPPNPRSAKAPSCHSEDRTFCGTKRLLCWCIDTPYFNFCSSDGLPLNTIHSQ